MPSLWIRRPRSKAKWIQAQTYSELQHQTKLCWSLFRVYNHVDIYTWPQGDLITHTKQIRALNDNDHVIAIGVGDQWNTDAKKPLGRMNNSDVFRKFIAIEAAQRAEKEREYVKRAKQAAYNDQYSLLRPIQKENVVNLIDHDTKNQYVTFGSYITSDDWEHLDIDTHIVTDIDEDDEEDDYFDSNQNIFDIFKSKDNDDDDMVLKPRSFNDDDVHLLRDTPLPQSSPIDIVVETPSNNTVFHTSENIEEK